MPSTRFVGGNLSLRRRLDAAPLELPVSRLGRQLGRSVEHLPPADDHPFGWLEECLTQHAVARAIARLDAEGATPGEAATVLEDRVQAEHPTLRIPMTIGAPGVASPYLRVPFGGRGPVQRLPDVDARDSWAPDLASRDDDLVERAAIEFVVAYNGVRDGFGRVLPTIESSLFSAFADIEAHWARGPKPDKVTALLDRLNTLAAPLWSDTTIGMIERASQLTVFSNFPLGVLRLPGESAPISCRVPISYRPVVPLTRAVQMEIEGRIVDLSDGFRVLVAECIPQSDEVGRLSRQGWDIGAEMFSDNPVHNCTLDRADVSSVDELRAAIDTVQPDVLVISAHGATAERVAGLVIGDELRLGPGLGPVPPVVVLSACHVTPRGRGSVNVADLLLREGALAVLGPHVPVDVRHNAILTVRLFVYMTQSVAGAQPYRTVLDAWAHTQTSNALIDILNGNPHLQQWGHALTPRGLPVLQDFMNRSAGRLRGSHIYEDSERVLTEIADEQGVGDDVRAWLRSPGYVPEAAFYAFIGKPEDVALRRPEPPPIASALSESPGDQVDRR